MCHFFNICIFPYEYDMNRASCSSSLISHKSEKSENVRSKSSETTCTSNSHCFLHKRKPANPLAFAITPSYKKASTVKQRVFSAKLTKLRTVQSQLNDANFHLAELARENQVLKTLQKRQDKALAKYENTNEDLPRLLHAHEEEIRVLTEKNKILKRNVKELSEQLKNKEEELCRTKEQLYHLEKLNKDKQLSSREKLLEQLEDLKIKLRKSEEQVTILNRKLIIEAKSSKQHLNFEIAKNKQSQKELMQALGEIEKLTGYLETRENIVQPKKNKPNKFPHRQSMSMVALGGYHAKTSSSSEKLNTKDKTIPVTDVKLEPIVCKQEEKLKKPTNDILNIPSENVKSRLSSGSSQGKEISENVDDQCRLAETNSKNRSNFSHKLEKLPFSLELAAHKETMRDPQDPLHSFASEDLVNDKTRLAQVKSTFGFNKFSLNQMKEEQESNRPSSREKLEKSSEILDAAIQKATENSNEEFDVKFGDYCRSVVNTVRSCSEAVAIYKDDLETSKNETDVLMSEYKKTTAIEDKLKRSLLNFDGAEMDFVNEILKESKTEKPSENKTTSLKKTVTVTTEEKRKLLATLKAIDNGNSIESLEEVPQRRDLLKSILGDVPH